MAPQRGNKAQISREQRGSAKKSACGAKDFAFGMNSPYDGQWRRKRPLGMPPSRTSFRYHNFVC
jgi:hypothetical protein